MPQASRGIPEPKTFSEWLTQMAARLGVHKSSQLHKLFIRFGGWSGERTVRRWMEENEPQVHELAILLTALDSLDPRVDVFAEFSEFMRSFGRTPAETGEPWNESDIGSPADDRGIPGRLKRVA